ncbi:glycosyltransferase family 4 protein [Blastococcus deserti]|uniref:Glycosyltransferase family 4 protein n=1 Tax=Blastococcus deserti TaxID=2259033 RepID=A0ABW4XCB8_9ACTN
MKALQGQGYEITVVTRPNNAVHLQADEDLAGVRVVGYDPPRAFTKLKRNGRGIIAFYYAWQVGVGRLLRRLHKERSFDVVHQYNFHTDWAPHFIKLEDVRVVWGPICHQPMLPPSYVRLERTRGLVREAAKAITKRVFWHLDPNLRRAISATDVILFANSDVPSVFRKSGKVQFQTFGGGLAGQKVSSGDAAGPLRLLHVGRSVSIKGGAVALETVRATRLQGADASLTMVGDGPLRSRLERHAASLGIADHVRFIPWLDQAALRHLYAEADVFLYPSLANQDGVVAEALAAGLPVVGVAGTGTEAMAADAGLWAPRRPHGDLVAGMAEKIATLAEERHAAGEAWSRRRHRAIERSRQLSWGATASAIAKRYAN